MKIKICGLTDLDVYWEAVDRGVDYTGFIFYPRSPRYIEPRAAGEIISRGPTGNHAKVGVFVNETVETVRRIASLVGLDIVQLHGDESPEYAGRLNLPYWKAIRVKDRNALAYMLQYDCNVFLMDTYVPGQYGGTGIPFSSALIQEAVETGRNRNVSIIAAGGISTRNVGSLLQLPNPPHAIDVNSSLEDSPGKKNKHKLIKFLKYVKSSQTPNKSLCGFPKGGFFRKSPLAAGGKNEYE